MTVEELQVAVGNISNTVLLGTMETKLSKRHKRGKNGNTISN